MQKKEWLTIRNNSDCQISVKTQYQKRYVEHSDRTHTEQKDESHDYDSKQAVEASINGGPAGGNVRVEDQNASHHQNSNQQQVTEEEDVTFGEEIQIGWAHVAPGEDAFCAMVEDIAYLTIKVKYKDVDDPDKTHTYTLLTKQALFSGNYEVYESKGDETWKRYAFKMQNNEDLYCESEFPSENAIYAIKTSNGKFLSLQKSDDKEKALCYRSNEKEASRWRLLKLAAGAQYQLQFDEAQSNHRGKFLRYERKYVGFGWSKEERSVVGTFDGGQGKAWELDNVATKEKACRLRCWESQNNMGFMARYDNSNGCVALTDNKEDAEEFEFIEVR